MTGQMNLSPAVLLAAYCLLILVASLGGGMLPIWLRLTHTRMQIATSAVAGLMLGVGLLHMFAHAAESLGSVNTAVGWMLAGFLALDWRSTSVLLRRFWSPMSDISATRLHSATGDIVVPRGETVDLVAELSGRTRPLATLQILRPDGARADMKIAPPTDRPTARAGTSPPPSR